MEAAAPRDPNLWRMAKARARFKSHLFTYLAVNGLLWVVWALTGRPSYPVPWPAWSTVFWGFGLAMQGFATYSGWNTTPRTEREYERLLRQKEGR